jgi:hypothetical protein
MVVHNRPVTSSFFINDGYLVSIPFATGRATKYLLDAATHSCILAFPRTISIKRILLANRKQGFSAGLDARTTMTGATTLAAV